MLSQFINDSRKFHDKIEEIYDFLYPLQKYYPQFRDWYFSIVIPQLGTETREIIAFYLNSELVGVSILKKTNKEKKICTIRVTPTSRKQGLGTLLFVESFDWLETNLPLITVPKSKVHQFDTLFKQFNFKLTDIKKNCYRDCDEEYIFNGTC